MPQSQTTEAIEKLNQTLQKIDALLEELVSDEQHWDADERYSRMKARIQWNQAKKAKREREKS
jgi:ElaB/YqjD/DUF883 family membrane-anchored ribosome-binding protein